MKKRILAVLLAAAMVLTALPTFLMSVAAETETYLDYVGGTFTAVALPDPLNVIDEETDAFVTGWNIIKGNVTFEKRITLPKDVGLILANGATLTAKLGITVAEDGYFSVYAQSTDETTMGKLVVPEGVDDFNAAIGATGEGHCGDIAIYGGVVNAQGGYSAAGIGSGFYNSYCENITIYGGVVNAQGGDNGAGIGGGYNINSGCHTITVSGGVVSAQGGDNGAGIGSGFMSFCDTVVISGGVVNAQGGKSGAGIGGGFVASCNSVTIAGGYIRAKNGGGAQPIGEGDSGSETTVSFDTSCMRIVKSDATYINYEPFEKTEPDCLTSATAAYYKDYVSGDYYAAFPFTEDGRIGDDDALATWKTSGGGYIAPLGHAYEYFDFFQHVCARCGDMNGHTYHNNVCSDCGITTSVKYYDYNAISKQFSQVTIDPYMEDLRGICSTDTDMEIDGGYYIVFGNVTINGTLTVSDDSELILGDGATLTVTNGIVLDGGDLSVYAQTLETTKMGTLVVTAVDAKRAAIGGDGNLVVNGGVVTATGAAGGAGIGSDSEGTCGNITLNGGVITAAGGTGAAGIGNGLNGTCGAITVGETLSLFASDAADSLAYCADYSDKRYAVLCKGTQTAAISPTCSQGGCKAYIQNTLDALYYEVSESGAKIGNAEALAAWKAEGGAGYVAIVDHNWIAVDENTHKCSYCKDVREHTYVNAPYICDACGYENLTAARADAKAALDEAAGGNPSDTMEAILNDAKAAVNTAETLVAIADAKEVWLPVVELRHIKDEAISVLDAAAGETTSTALQAGLDAAEDLINAATTESEVDEIKKAVLPVIAAQAVAEAEATAQMLASTQTAAKAALTVAAGEEPSDELTAILNSAIEAVDDATTIETVQTAEEAGFAAIATQLAAEAATAKQAVEKELAQTKQELLAATVALEAAQKNLEDTITALNEAKAANEQLQKDLAAANVSIAELNNTVKSKNATIAEKQAALDTATEQLNTAKADLDKEKANLETAQVNIEKLEGTVSEQDEALKQAAQDLKDAQTKLDEMTENYNTASAALDDVKKALEEAKAANEKAKNDLAVANEAITALNEEVANKDATIAEKLAAVESAQKALDDATAKVTKLEGTVSEQDETLKQAEQDMKALQAEIDRLKELLEDKPTDPQPTETIGDANGDGAVNMKDVLLMRKYLAELDVECDAKNADVNGDGEVNMKDVLMLRKYLAGLIETLGA